MEKLLDREGTAALFKSTHNGANEFAEFDVQVAKVAIHLTYVSIVVVVQCRLVRRSAPKICSLHTVASTRHKPAGTMAQYRA